MAAHAGDDTTTQVSTKAMKGDGAQATAEDSQNQGVMRRGQHKAPLRLFFF